MTVTRSGLLNVHGWLALSNSKNRPFTFQFDPNHHSDNSKWLYLGGPFAPEVNVNYHLFVLSPNSKLLATAGHWDNSFRVHSVDKGKLIARLAHHNGTDPYTSHSTYPHTLTISCNTYAHFKHLHYNYGDIFMLTLTHLHILTPHTCTQILWHVWASTRLDQVNTWSQVQRTQHVLYGSSVVHTMWVEVCLIEQCCYEHVHTYIILELCPVILQAIFDGL